MVGAGVTRLSHRVSCFVRGERKEMEFHENIGLELSLNDEVAKKKKYLRKMKTCSIIPPVPLRLHIKTPTPGLTAVNSRIGFQ